MQACTLVDKHLNPSVKYTDRRDSGRGHTLARLRNMGTLTCGIAVARSGIGNLGTCWLC